MKPPAAQSTGKELPDHIESVSMHHNMAWDIRTERQGGSHSLGVIDESATFAAELVRRWNSHEEMAATLRVAASTLRLAPDDELVVEKTIQRIMTVLSTHQP